MLTTYLIIVFLGILVIATIVLRPFYTKFQRNKIGHTDFPVQWREILQKEWPQFQRIPDLLKEPLYARILVFLSEKKFYPCDGFELQEKHKLLIAAQACLLIVNKPYEYYDQLNSILIYPSAFLVKRSVALANGTLQDQESIHAGEAWSVGRVILSWDEVESGMKNPSDGNNVVIHEFAHLLDYTSGDGNGAPLLEHAKNYDKWSQVFSLSYEHLLQKYQHGEKVILNPYGLTSPAEYFAVVSELFFENSKLLEKHEPALHHELVKFYAVDPGLW